jgi:hypothetical protein
VEDPEEVDLEVAAAGLDVTSGRRDTPCSHEGLAGWKREAVGHSDGVGIMAIAKVPSSSLGAAEV